ncbi:hypothetical protein C8R45DRAFT_82912 [Mycena sanguinolenta]|nr:hypothetical protein C8R45DRAFT_82912 [Mycena sanguinolenta]
MLLPSSASGFKSADCAPFPFQFIPFRAHGRTDGRTRTRPTRKVRTTRRCTAVTVLFLGYIHTLDYTPCMHIRFRRRGQVDGSNVTPSQVPFLQVQTAPPVPVPVRPTARNAGTTQHRSDCIVFLVTSACLPATLLLATLRYICTLFLSWLHSHSWLHTHFGVGRRLDRQVECYPLTTQLKSQASRTKIK